MNPQEDQCRTISRSHGTETSLLSPTSGSYPARCILPTLIYGSRIRSLVLGSVCPKTLGEEYGQQNPIYTVRTFPENLFLTDGTNAYGQWTGGMLGVLGKQMEDFADFNKKWFLENLALDFVLE